MEMLNDYVLNIYSYLTIIVAFVTVGILIFIRNLRRNDDYWKKRGVPYCPRSSYLTIFRSLAESPLHDLYQKNYKNYGRVHGGFEFSKPILTVADPELLRQILVKDFHNFSYRRENMFKDPLLENMVSILKGDDWKRVRTVITPAFTSKRMRTIGCIINSCTKTMLETFEAHFRKGSPIDCREVFGAFSVDVIASAAFATKVDSINDPENIFVKMLKQAFQELSIFHTILLYLLSVLSPRLLTWFRIGGLKPMDFFKNLIQQVIKDRRRTGKKYNDILQTLMDAAEEEKSKSTSVMNFDAMDDESDRYGSIINSGIPSYIKCKRLTEDELISQCVMFFFVGYETTASTLTFMAYQLALNPEWQEKLIAEVDESFVKHAEMSNEAVRNMKVLDAVVSETLRMYPAGIGTERTAGEDYKLGNTGIVVEKGMIVNIPIYAMHYDPEFFHEPEKFNPERFLGTTKYSHPSYAYLPFGAGPRNCLGMRFALLEIKLCMSNILRNYKFRLAPTTKVPPVYKKISAILSVNELPLTVEERKIQL